MISVVSWATQKWSPCLFLKIFTSQNFSKWKIEAIYELPVAVYFRKSIKKALNHYNVAPCYSENVIHWLIYVTSFLALKVYQWRHNRWLAIFRLLIKNSARTVTWHIVTDWFLRRAITLLQLRSMWSEKTFVNFMNGQRDRTGKRIIVYTGIRQEWSTFPGD
jgi:hypothetical protein